MPTNKQQLVPALRFPEFEGEWKVKRLEDLVSTFKSGNNITSANIYDKGKYPVYGGNGLRGYTSTYTHEGFHFLIGRQGALCGNINRTYGKVYISEHAIAAQANNEADTEWLAQKLDFHNLNRLSESTAQPGLSAKKLLRLKLPIPSLPEQQKIANFLSIIDKKKALLAELSQYLEVLKKGLMQQLLTGKWRFQEFIKEEGLKSTKLGVIPKSWTIQTLGKIAHIDKNKLDSKSPLDYKFSYITLSDVKEGKINDNLESFLLCDAPSRAKKIVKKGNVLLATVRPNLKGFAYINKEVENVVASTGFSVIEENGKADTRFIYHHLYARAITAQIYAITVGSNYPAINSSDVKKLKIPLPSLPEQKKIAACLSLLDQRIQNLQAQLEVMQEYKKGLMQQLLV